MRTLTVISFPRQHTAGEAAVALERLHVECFIQLDDISWVTRRADGRLTLHRGNRSDTVTTGAGSRLLSQGLSSLLPLFGIRLRDARRGSASESEMDDGSNSLMNEFASNGSWPGSALLFIADSENATRILPEIEKFEGAVIRVSQTVESKDVPRKASSLFPRSVYSIKTAGRNGARNEVELADKMLP
jgi:uncharacterized membrane protein